MNWADSLGLATIMLDPGHGDIFDKSLDPGAVGPAGIHEKDYALNLALQIGTELERLGHNVMYTRKCDVNKKRQRWQWRADMSNKAKADLFISLHLDSYPETKNYFKTFYYQENARWIAENIMNSINQSGITVVKPEKEGMQVLRPIVAPGVLIEAGNINNFNTPRLIVHPSFAKQIAEGINRSLKGDLYERY